MKYNVSFSQIVDRLVVVLNNSELTAEYRRIPSATRVCAAGVV